MRPWSFGLALWTASSGCESRSAVCAGEGLGCEGQVFRTCADDGRIKTEDCGKNGMVCVPGEGCLDCAPGDRSCHDDVAIECGDTGKVVGMEDCAAQRQVCVGGACKVCRPDETRCCSRHDTDCQPGIDVLICDATGDSYSVLASCDAANNEICAGGEEAPCKDACELAAERPGSTGCEFYAVDLDNAAADGDNAAEQQFGIVLSNLGPLAAHVVLEQNDAPPGSPPVASIVREYDLGPGMIATIDDLPPREVDGSPPGTYDTGTETAFTSNAYRITSTTPIVAYQFNPLQAGAVFSNDASLLLPTTAAQSSVGSTYLVMGWPQLLADTNDPDTDAGIDLRSFLAIVGTQADTHVTVQTKSDVIGSPDVPSTSAGGTIEFDLGPFDVLNLESEGFGSDFSGSRVLSDKPVLVFSGSECADVPAYQHHASRPCCCDHLEEQLAPVPSLGKAFVAVQTPLRTVALAAAGSDIEPLSREKEYWRLLSSVDTVCATSLPAPVGELSLDAGEPVTLEASQDFVIECDDPVVVAQFVASQSIAVGSNNNDQPAGDPAFILTPPVEQYREEHLLVVPHTYAFDFLMIAARADATVWIDGNPAEDYPYCERDYVGQLTVDGQPTDFVAIKCALSAPVIYPGSPSLDPGIQRDGAHRVDSTEPIGVVVYGFDGFVSYGYPAGMGLAAINIE